MVELSQVNMKYFLITVLLLPLLLLKASDKPNIVLILSDDQAWTDYGFMGHKLIKTPQLDRLAEQSLIFERGYVAAPLCRPSLATMITGLYPEQPAMMSMDRITDMHLIKPSGAIFTNTPALSEP